MNGEKIRIQRELCNLTQAELAEIMKVDRTAVTKWETDSASPRAAMLPDLAKALNCKIEDLY